MTGLLGKGRVQFLFRQQGPAGQGQEKVMKDPREFERPIQDLEAQIENLTLFGEGKSRDKELAALRKKLEKTRKEVFAKLTPWQTVQVARHPKRPYTLDYMQALFTDWQELHGDRRYADDPAIVAGFARFHGQARVRHRPPEGARHQAEDLPQLRHAQAGGLPQGAADHAAWRRSSACPS